MGTFSILQGDVRDWLPLFPDSHFDACFCDPPLSPDFDLSPRRLLIPFSGAGSEIAGALLAGWDEVLGVEQDPESIEWSEARIPAALESLSHLSKV